jgi:hypothetical protein
MDNSSKVYRRRMVAKYERTVKTLIEINATIGGLELFNVSNPELETELRALRAQCLKAKDVAVSAQEHNAAVLAKL